MAGFDDSDYAVITKSVPQSVDGAAVTVVMSGIGESVTSLELCVINRLRRRVVTFASVSTISGDDTVRLPVGRMDVSVYSALQAGCLTPSCVQCHGGSNHAAAGLYLTGDRSRESLVDIPSTVVGDAVRVLPGNANESILYGVVSTDMTRGWSFDHSALLDVTSVEFIKTGLTMEQNNITKYSHVTIDNNNAMEYSHVTLGSGSVDVKLAAFKPAEGVAEYHAMFRCLIPGTTFSEQLDGVLQAYDELSATLGRDVRPVFGSVTS